MIHFFKAAIKDFETALVLPKILDVNSVGWRGLH